MRPPPTTLEILEALALRDPRRLMLMEDGIPMSRGQFYALAANCATQLRKRGVRPRDRVAIAGPGFARQLLALFACEALGAVTASFQPDGDTDAPVLFELVDWILAGRPQEVPAGKRFVLLDDGFVGGLAQPPSDEGRGFWHALDDGELQRITRTSGSTGRSKFIALSRRAQEFWIRGNGIDDAFGEASRLLVTGPLVINAAFTRTSRCLRSGGAVMTGSGADIARMDPTDVWGLPMQIERLLGEMPPGWEAPRPVSVATVGGAVAPALRERLQVVFRGTLPNRYGSNEVGPICDTMDANGTGLLSPGVDLRILGPDGSDLPPGQYGTIVVRTTGMAEGYLGLPEENAAAFRDGWFHSADVGALVGPRLLHLAGRQDDLLNLGGIKVPVSTVEAGLRRQPAVAECAVLAVNLRGGSVSIGAAIVLAPGATEDDAKAQVASALALGVTTTVAIRFLDRLPVLQTGKLDRMALQRLFLGMQ